MKPEFVKDFRRFWRQEKAKKSAHFRRFPASHNSRRIGDRGMAICRERTDDADPGRDPGIGCIDNTGSRFTAVDQG